MADQEIQREGLTRREVLKKGALLGGALAWGTPVVQVIGMRPAMAASTSPTCPNLYCIKIEFDSGSPVVTGCSRGHERGRGNCLVPPDDTDFEVPAEILGQILVTETTCGDEPGIQVTLPDSCSLAGTDNITGTPDAFVGGVSAAAKCGFARGRFDGPVPEPCDPPVSIGENEDGATVLCFTERCSNGTSISHIELIICCN